MLEAKISFGNLKLPKDTMIFNLPARITCPGKSAFCAGACYALKAERIYKNVLPARVHNFDLTRRADFIQIMTQTINQHKTKIKRVRVHESGDFYNQLYLDSWFSIASAFPDIRFYAYTKSFHLNFEKKPSNFWIIASFDASTSDKQKQAYSDKRAYFENTFTIIDRHARASCVADCTKCNACWTLKGKNITVSLH